MVSTFIKVHDDLRHERRRHDPHRGRAVMGNFPATPGYDYLIDNDGRPIKEGETPASGEAEPQVVAAE
jgi:hypothetical protein